MRQLTKILLLNCFPKRRNNAKLKTDEQVLGYLSGLSFAGPRRKIGFVFRPSIKEITILATVIKPAALFFGPLLESYQLDRFARRCSRKSLNLLKDSLRDCGCYCQYVAKHKKNIVKYQISYHKVCLFQKSFVSLPSVRGDIRTNLKHSLLFRVQPKSLANFIWYNKFEIICDS